MAGETKFCPECGRPNPVGMRFCGHCGAALPAPIAPADPSTVLPPEIEPTRKLETAALASAVTPTLELNRAPVFEAPRVDVVVPSDPIARERERDRLLSLASVQRMRAQILDARASLQKAIVVSAGMPGPQVAPIHEMMGDMLASEERWEQAAAAYEQAQILDPTRLSAERKFGEMTLRIADEKAMAKLGGLPDSSADALASGSRGKRNPGFAMILSLIGPGFGQFYNGQFIKGCVCLGVFVVAMFLVTLTPDVRAIHCVLTPGAPGCRGLTVSPLTWFCFLACAAAWLFSLVDAPYFASKTEGLPGESGPVIDKTGWEV